MLHSYCELSSHSIVVKITLILQMVRKQTRLVKFYAMSNLKLRETTIVMDSAMSRAHKLSQSFDWLICSRKSFDWVTNCEDKKEETLS